ncbi:MAG: RNA-binding S4 domain-containing protein [Pseudomonadota bacterium]|nr:RNA-binding S4 domain-containing protein [Pseudomonadota bacterium]|tara:strand:- start:259 stop:648 length:390 start_codon:yes stop_codon:yes gene_type:complete
MEKQRIDQWLWFARLFKSRSMATKFCVSGKIRVNEKHIKKGHHLLGIGDIITFQKDSYIRVISVLALGNRRGPAQEAKTLYEDLSPPRPPAKLDYSLNTIFSRSGLGRPTKRDRRKLENFTCKNKFWDV